MIDAIISHPMYVSFVLMFNLIMLGVSVRKFIAEWDIDEKRNDKNAILVALSILGTMLATALYFKLLVTP